MVCSGSCVSSRSFVLRAQVPNRKTPWKLSSTRKANVRARLKKVDAVIEAVRASGVQCAALVRFNALPSASYSVDCFDQTKALELPKEHEMLPKDKYTVFSPHTPGYRKGIHKVPKWTRVSSLPLAPWLRLMWISAHSTDQPRGLLE